MRQDDLLIAQDVAADNVIVVLLRHGEDGEPRRKQIADDLALIEVEVIPLFLTVMRNRRLIRCDEVIVKEEIIPKPQPECLLLFLGRILICAHVIKVARVDHRGTSNIELILGTAEVFTDAVQEFVELDVQLLHLNALVLLDVLDGQAVDLLPCNALRQTKPPRDVEHLEIRIQFAEVDVIVACLTEIGQKGTHPRKIVLGMTLERTAINMRVGIAEKECQIIDADEEPCEGIIPSLNDREKVLDAVPVGAEVLPAPPTPRRCAQIALDQRACNEDIRTSVFRIKTLD